jgi:transcriptional regulator with XRE-family HTH domain
MAIVDDRWVIVNSRNTAHTWAMNEMERFAALVREAMDMKGLTQSAVAVRLGWSQSIVSDLLRGKRSAITPDVLTALESVLSLDRRRSLVALGYLNGDEVEPGIAYVIREDDPRANLLAMVEGLSAPDIAAVAGAAGIFAKALRREAGEDNGGGNLRQAGGGGMLPPDHLGTG